MEMQRQYSAADHPELLASNFGIRTRLASSRHFCASMKIRLDILGAIFGATVLVSSVANADEITLPPASAYTSWYDFHTQEIINTPGISTDDDGDTATANLDPLYVSASVDHFSNPNDPDYGHDFFAEAGIDYYFEIIGPENGPVPISVQFNENSSATGETFGEAFVRFPDISNLQPISGPSPNYVGDGYQVCSVDIQSSCTGIPDATSATISMTVPANTLEEVELFAFAEVFELNTVDGFPIADNSSATVDPYITLNTAGYTLEFSPGVANTPPAVVSEPSSLSMLLMGLGLIGGALYLGKKPRQAI